MALAFEDAAGPAIGPAALSSGGAGRSAGWSVGWSVADIIEAAARAAGTDLTEYQRAYLADSAPLRVVLKARQIGFSWLFALEALAEALSRGQFSIFVSLNREEAAEKILYARDLYEGLPVERRPPLLRGGTHELRFSGGGRLLSFPCRAPRGKARANLYLDEMAFYPNSEAVYAGALPVISHGGRVTLASTPFGERGMFWRALMETGLSGQFSRHTTPWWLAPWFCTDVAAARDLAGGLTTEERVRRFGTPTLLRLCGAMDLASFQQEYELLFVETGSALIPWADVEAAAKEYDLASSWRDLPGHGALYAGMDVGRWQDPTEIIVLSAEGGSYRVRALRSLRRVPYREQEETVTGMMEGAPIRRLCMDARGLGGQMGESLYRRFGSRVQPLTFTAPLKESMALRLRLALENREMTIPRVRSLMEQIHAVRDGTTDHGRRRLDAPRGPEGHADQFWALAMALHAAQEGSAIHGRTLLFRA